MCLTRDISVGRAVALFILVVCVGWVSGGAGTEPADDTIDTTLIDAAEDAGDLNDAYASLLCDAPPEGLAKLLTSDSTGLALQAAWEEVKRSMPRSPASPVRSRRSGMSRLNRVSLARFIGFVEGRLRVTVPDWWEDHLLIAKGGAIEDIDFLAMRIPDTGRGTYGNMPAYSGTKELDIDVEYNGGVSKVEVIGDQLAIHLEDCVFQVDRPSGSTIYVSVMDFKTSGCLALVHDNWPGGILLNIDSSDGKVLWQQELWCDRAYYIRGGDGGFHWSEVKTKGDTVFVFGLRNDLVYIEAFELRTGKPQFRFSTTYGWSIAKLAPRKDTSK